MAASILVSLERVLKVQKTALKPSEHQIYHSNMNEGSDPSTVIRTKKLSHFSKGFEVSG
jgi:hypothetical protein